MPESRPIGNCLRCSYSLLANAPNACPECGLTFDPAVPDSYQREGTPWHARWWHRPPPVWLNIVSIAWCLYVIVKVSHPLGATVGPANSCTGIVVTVLSFGFSIAIVLDTLVRWLLCSKAGPIRLATRRQWYTPFLCTLVVLSAIFSSWPLHARFALSRSAFEEHITASKQGRANHPLPGWLGLFYVYDYRALGGAAYFDLGEELLGERGGFIRLHGDPATHGVQRDSLFVDNWLIGIWDR